MAPETNNSAKQHMSPSPMRRHLSQAEARQLDSELMSDAAGWSLAQLMELAGLSVAQAIREEYEPETYRRVLLVCGPGNNGGDGLVCSRHLAMFGYRANVHMPKRSTTSQLFAMLERQCRYAAVTFIEDLPTADALSAQYDIVVDAVFGFGFSGDVREPFDVALKMLAAVTIPVVSVDVPSGWDVERGDVSTESTGLRPDMLVSLSAPKLCARHFTGRHHYLGGRFIPGVLAERFALDLPVYPGASQTVRLSRQE